MIDLDELKKKFIVYVALTPIRVLRREIVDFKTSLDSPIKPNTLIVIATALFVITLYFGGIILIIASFLALCLALIHKEWEKGDWRKNPPL